jgi:nitroimidazol reductase NimA-like FMN-containing flavoprotein (pyridoxamine 5'-phosphate oxidase superfamily)
MKATKGAVMQGTDWKTGMIILEPAECWRLLHEEVLGRLAVAIAGEPEIFPVNHVVDDHTLVFTTAAGTKLAGAVCGKAVAYEVDGYDSWTGDAWSVVVKGHAVELETTPEREHAERLALLPWASFPKPHWVRIDPVEVTGRRFHVVAAAQPMEGGPTG